MKIKNRRVGLVAAAALLVALSVLFPAQIAVEPQPVGQPVYRVSIGNPALAHDADTTCDGVDDHIQLQALLDLLPAAVGGRIEVEAGYYSWGTGETVTRNISNVTIIGVGGLVSFDGDDTTPLFEAGGDNWLFENIVTDAGGIDTGATSGYLFRNVLIGTTYYAYVTDSIDIEDHSARHESGGDDAIKLDDLATPDDNSDLDATTGYHGLLPKLAGNASVFLSGNGSWIAPAGSGEGDMLKSTYDTDEDDLIDTAAGGTEWDSSAATGVAYITTGSWANRPTGIADTNILIVSGSVASTEHCRFTADGIEGLSSAELLAAISGEAGASFDWNGQDLTNVGDIDGRDISADGTKLDTIEDSADVTDAANVAAAGALMDSDTDNVDDLHINWGSGAGQVDADDVAESGSRFWAGESGADVTSTANVDAAGAVMESDYNATTFLYATLDDTPEVKTPAEVLAILSGEATGSFDWNGQDLTNVGDVDGRDISADGTKLDGIEAGADVTDAANVDTAGAVMETDFDATTFLYATSDDTPQPKTPAEVLAILSGDAGAAFDWNAQQITNWQVENGATVPVSPADYQLFLHTPTGRKVLLQYDGSNWIALGNLGTMTMYVDNTDGTDGMNYGTGVDADAFKTVQYAVDQIPADYGGDVIIEINDETYAETVTIQGKSPTGAYTITLSGVLASQEAVSSATVTAGSGATQGTVAHADFNGDDYANMLVYLATDDVYRVIDSHATTTLTVTGTCPSSTSQDATVYDWDTQISTLVVAAGQLGIVVEDIEITTTLTTYADASLTATRCKVRNASFQFATQYISESLFSYAGTVLSDVGGYTQVYRTKIISNSDTGIAVYVRDNGICWLMSGTIIDGDAGGGNKATYGVYSQRSTYVNYYSVASAGYVRVRNCDTGLRALNGAQQISTSMLQYLNNGTDESADSTTYAYID